MPDLTRRNLLQASAGVAAAVAAASAFPGAALADSPTATGTAHDDHPSGGPDPASPVIAEVTGSGEVTVYAGSGAAVLHDRDLAARLTAAARQAAKG